MKSNRRNFLKTAGIAAAGIGFSPSLISATLQSGAVRVSPADKIRVVLIGCGGRGHDNLGGFIGNEDVRIVAVCDVDDSHSASAKSIIDKTYGSPDCRVYKDFRDMLEKEKPDAAVLSLPDHWHALAACTVADQKIHVYGEKPVARTLAESRAVVNAVKRNGITWQTGSRHFPADRRPQ